MATLAARRGIVGVPSVQIDEQAFVRGIEMLDQHEGHAVVDRQRVEELLEGVKTSSRGSQGKDREVNTRWLRGGSRAAQDWGYEHEYTTTSLMQPDA